MARSKNGGPACPKTERLEELMEQFNLEINKPWQQEIYEALDWLHTMLSNRKTYHAKRQAEQKIFMETAKKILGEDEIKAIQQQAERQVADGKF